MPGGLTRWPAGACLWASLAGLPVAVVAQSEDPGGFGGPESTEKQIAEDRAPRPSLIDAEPLKTWRDWKAELTERTGLSFSVDYSATALSASDSLPGTDDEAAAGMVRFYGAWELFGRGGADTGALVWKLEHRHAYGEPAPSGFALGNLGYVGFMAPPFNDQGFRATNLYWRQRLGGGRSTLVAGFLDATDYLDAYGLASPWTHFTNLAFSTGSAAIALPNEVALGAAFGTMLADHWYLIGGLVDANSDPEEIFDGFDTFFSDHEFFKSVEIGWTTGQGRLVLDNYHLTLWHKDEQDELAVPDGWGINLSFSRYVGERWLPFLRGGWADDAGSLLEASLSAGVGYQPVAGGNLLGVGLNWGRPNEDTFGPGLDDQFTAEMFYRVNVGRNFAVTGDIQYLRDPALNPAEDSVWVFSLRGRLVF